jgi:hypothetical protein
MFNQDEEFGFLRHNIMKSNKKTYIMKKIDLDQNTNLQTKITEAFTNPEKYLDINDKDMIIGRVTQYPRISRYNTSKKISTLGSAFLRISRTQSFMDRTLKLIKTSNLNTTKTETKRKPEKKNSFIIAEKGIQEIYNKFRHIKENTVDKAIDICDDDLKIKREMKKILETQEKILKAQENKKLKSEKLGNYIATKSKKKGEDVLMNKTDGFRIKQEIKNIMEVQKPLGERYGEHNWMISLRRPDNFEGTRYAFVNYGNSDKVNWVRVKEKLPEKEFLETVRFPDSIGINEVSSLKNFKYFNKTLYEKYNIDLDEVQKMNGMTV